MIQQQILDLQPVVRVVEWMTSSVSSDWRVDVAWPELLRWAQRIYDVEQNAWQDYADPQSIYLQSLQTLGWPRMNRTIELHAHGLRMIGAQTTGLDYLGAARFPLLQNSGVIPHCQWMVRDQDPAARRSISILLQSHSSTIDTLFVLEVLGQTVVVDVQDQDAVLRAYAQYKSGTWKNPGPSALPTLTNPMNIMQMVDDRPRPLPLTVTNTGFCLSPSQVLGLLKQGDEKDWVQVDTHTWVTRAEFNRALKKFATHAERWGT